MILAEAIIINSKGEEVNISKEFNDNHSAAEWVKRLYENENCVYAGCPTLAFTKDELGGF